MKSVKAPANTDDYIASFSKEIQDVLTQVRQTIQRAAPEATEAISYGIPTFVLHGNLVHFAAFKNHIGFYSLPSGTAAFQKELVAYKSGRGSVQFPLNEPMPLALITEIVKFRVAENKAKANGAVQTKKSNSNSNPEVANQKNGKSFLENISAPARRALEAAGITTLQKLSTYNERELLALHGVGKTTIPKLEQALSANGLQLKQ
ncbi:MAG: DUF1801 domain-containing protein [Chitinophagaceae bacterium]